MHCIDVHAVPPLISLGLFVLVLEWWCCHECSRLLLLPTPDVMACYSNLVISWRALELIFVFKSSNSVFVLLFCLFLSLIGRPVRFHNDFAGVEDISACEVLLALHDSVHNFLTSVGLFRVMSDCTVSSVKDFPAYSRSIEVENLHEECAAWYPYNAASEEASAVSPRAVYVQKRAAGKFLTSRKVREVPVRLTKCQMMMMSEELSVAKAAVAQLDEAVPLHPDEVFDGDDNGDTTPAEHVCVFGTSLIGLTATCLLFSKYNCSVRNQS